MTLSKRACRRYADPKLAFQQNNGLLHSGQIKYIVRTTIKNVGGKRILLLYIYLREQLIKGEYSPLWTMFQGKEDFITLTAREDGSLSWRVSNFDNLEYGIENKLAFYTLADKARVARYCGGNQDALVELAHLQCRIKAKKELERRHKKQRLIIERMNTLKTLPRDIRGWLHREILPQYLFYTYSKGKAAMNGYCTACRHEVSVSAPKHNSEGICPRCRKAVTFKSRGKRGYLSDRCTAQVVQRVTGDELVIRVIKVYCNYRKEEVPKLSVYESTRIFVRRDDHGKCQTEPYHHSFECGDLTPWKKGYCPVMYVYQTNFNAEVCGHLYHRNLDEVFRGTPWQYSQLKQFYLFDKEPMAVAPYLEALLEYPQLEMLFKMGFYKLTCDLVYRSSPKGLLACAGKKPFDILKVWPEDIATLRRMNGGEADLRTFQKYRKKGIRPQIRAEIFDWMKKHNLRDDHEILRLMKHMTIYKLFGYAEKQFTLLHGRKNDNGQKRYESMGRILDEYQDYLQMCEEQQYDMESTFVLFPRNLQQAHDRLSDYIKAKLDAEQKRKFLALYRQVSKTLCFERDGLVIAFPRSPKDIVAEGNALRHCVGGYVSRVANGDCIILFLRHVGNTKESFYTIEVRNGEVAQVRGLQNCEPTPEVKRFITNWKQKVLQRAELPAAA